VIELIYMTLLTYFMTKNQFSPHLKSS